MKKYISKKTGKIFDVICLGGGVKHPYDKLKNTIYVSCEEDSVSIDGFIKNEFFDNEMDDIMSVCCK